VIILKDINLMPRNVVIKKESTRLLKVAGLVAAITLAAAVVMDFGIFAGSKVKEAQIKGQEEVMGKLYGAQTNFNLIKSVEGKRDYLNNVVKKLYDSRQDYTSLMENLQAITPSDLSITELLIQKDGQVKIRGKADTEQSILSFYHDLKLKGIADYIKFNNISGAFNDSKGMEFNVEFKLNGRK
jgi:Tfp pilus assembly protein PilN